MNQDHEETRADPLYNATVAFVAEEQSVLSSEIQRKHKIGYNRACNLVDAMELNGVVTKAGHNGCRGVLIAKSGKGAAMAEVNTAFEQTAGVEITSDEVRWRMEIVKQAVLSTGDSFQTVTKDFNKALATLNQGNA